MFQTTALLYKNVVKKYFVSVLKEEDWFGLDLSWTSVYSCKAEKYWFLLFHGCELWSKYMSSF